jgi:hypothetical protein
VSTPDELGIDNYITQLKVLIIQCLLSSPEFMLLQSKQKSSAGTVQISRAILPIDFLNKNT